MKKCNFPSRKMRRVQNAYMRFSVDTDRAEVDKDYQSRKEQERQAIYATMAKFGGLSETSRTKKSRAGLRSY